MARRIRIALTYIAYPVAMGRYFHEAMIQNTNIEVWMAGPFTGQNIPWVSTETGLPMILPKKYVLKPNHPLPIPARGPTISYPMLEIEKPWEPDLWIEVNGGLSGTGKPTSAPLAMVLSDPHVLGGFYAEQRQRADYIFNMQTPYMVPGDIHLPYAYSKRWHTPTEIPFEEREYDAALIGLQYKQRTDLVDRLRAEGLNVFYDLGPAYDDARDIYHNSRIGLNWSSLEDTNARCFELMALGITPVMNQVTDLMRMFSTGNEYAGFITEGEAVNKTLGALEDPETAIALAEMAQEAVRPHTWDARVQSILEETGTI